MGASNVSGVFFSWQGMERLPVPTSWFSASNDYWYLPAAYIQNVENRHESFSIEKVINIIPSFFWLSITEKLICKCQVNQDTHTTLKVGSQRLTLWAESEVLTDMLNNSIIWQVQWVITYLKTHIWKPNILSRYLSIL